MKTLPRAQLNSQQNYFICLKIHLFTNTYNYFYFNSVTRHMVLGVSDAKTNVFYFPKFKH